ncbi:MAG: sodium-dependent transporter, partial [bacterium]
GSKLGFIMAASGSAIGLGNIVFFGANAYKFGAGAFYFPYLLALCFVGIPVMILELGLGHYTHSAFPESLYRVAGRKGEFFGWWGVLNATFITMYYITILAWVSGMLLGSFGSLWKPFSAVTAFGLDKMANPQGYFFNMLSSWKTVGLVVVVWIFNILIVWRGPKTIEPVVKVFVPLMWVFMIILIVRGITLPQGVEGIYLLFTPNLSIMGDPKVWQGAFSQIFFTLSLGFGIMTAYASYLPRKSDQVNNALATSFMNCGFEFIAGLAIFSLLFAFAIVPRASTLSMMFFVIPQGINALPGGVVLFGLLFFILLLLAGLSSSISLIEALVAAVMDKYRLTRKKILFVFSTVGCIGSIFFALPIIIDPPLKSDGTLGLTLLDLTDHYAFSHGLLITGLVECLFIGWVLPVRKLREAINQFTRIRLPGIFDYFVKILIPAILLFILGYSISELLKKGIYGHDFNLEFGKWLPVGILVIWLAGTTIIGLVLTFAGDYKKERR